MSHWYFVCACCGCKFLSRFYQRLPCARCGQVCESHEQLEPPWLAQLDNDNTRAPGTQPSAQEP
jgi:hypothetical protein